MEMGRNVSVGARKLMARALVYAGLLSMGIAASYGADLELVPRGAAVGDDSSPRLRADSRDIAPAPGLAWKVSVGVFTALQAADAATSYGYPEANALYGQRFGARGIALKALIAAAVPLVERRIVRHHQGAERAFTALNFSLAGATSRAVIYNARDIASRPAATAPIVITPGVGTVGPPQH